MYKQNIKIQNRKMTPDRIAFQLRNDIITQVYPKGENLVEADIAERFGTSRGSVRVALQTLENEGLIHALPNGRKIVVGFSRKQAEDMYELRWMIENRALETVIKSSTSFFSPLLTVLQKIELCSKEMSSETDWFDLDIQFHRALVLAADNIPLLKAWDINSPIMYALMNLNTTKDYKERYIREFYDKHKLLFEYIVTKNQKCYKELHKHIQDAMDISFGILE